MSRSRRKYPISIQEKDNKRYYRRAVRHRLKHELRTNRKPRRLSMFWNCKYRWTKEEALSSGHLRNIFVTDEAIINYWERVAVRK